MAAVAAAAAAAAGSWEGAPRRSSRPATLQDLGTGPLPALRWQRAVRRPPSAAIRRRRLVVCAALVVTILACVALAGGLGTGSSGSSHSSRAGHPLRPSGSTAGAAVTSFGSVGTAPVGARVYIVRPGDTLWGIATRLASDGDPRPLVQRLAAQVPGGILVVGERLVLP